VKKIADSGLLIALLDASDSYHSWAVEIIGRESPPWLVCEPVLSEVSASVQSAEPVLELLKAGDIELAFELNAEKNAVLSLVKKYRDQRIDLADACVVRMSEIFPNSTVFTVDKKDFLVYRRHGKRPIRCVFPQ
jgi:predicted nucleic acid-binding protein